jgi:hypothetical protein
MGKQDSAAAQAPMMSGNMATTRGPTPGRDGVPGERFCNGIQQRSTDSEQAASGSCDRRMGKVSMPSARVLLRSCTRASCGACDKGQGSQGASVSIWREFHVPKKEQDDLVGLREHRLESCGFTTSEPAARSAGSWSDRRNA